MSLQSRQFDFWYAVHNTKIVRGPSRALETFGATRINYHHLAELPDDPRKVRVREGRLEAHKPAIITPEEYAEAQMDGFGAEARQYLEFLKANRDNIRILQYGYQLRQEAFSEQVVTDSLEAVTGRVVKEVEDAKDDFAAVIQGVDAPWDVSLVHFFWLHVNASAPINVRTPRSSTSWARSFSVVACSTVTRTASSSSSEEPSAVCPHHADVVE